MTGKEKCQYLRELRIKIAQKYNIPYTPHECTHEDDCTGMCPMCKKEIDELNDIVNRQRSNPRSEIDKQFENEEFRLQQEIDDLYRKRRFRMSHFGDLVGLPIDDISYNVQKPTEPEDRKKIIFLDFDGVMDTEYYDSVLVSKGLPECDGYGVVFDPDCVANLANIIEATGADIVVSSSWKDLMTFEQILGMWEFRQLPGRVIDTTPTISRKRGDEIDQWLNECHRECLYVIIDDLDGSNFNEHQIPNLLCVNPYNGLDSETAHRAIFILNKS